jgi:fused signal recognition particle receptor
MDFQKLTTNLLNSMAGVSEKFGSGNVVADVVVLLLILSLIALCLGLVSMYRNSGKGDGGYERYGSIAGRVEKVDMTLNEFKTNALRTNEMVKSDLGYVKQELSEIKALLRNSGGGGGERGTGGYGGGGDEPKNRRDFTRATELAAEIAETAASAEVVESPAAEQGEVPESLSARMTKTRLGLFDRIKVLFSGKPKLDAAAFDELEAMLVGADLGIKTASGLLEELKTDIQSGHDIDQGRLVAMLKLKILNILEKGAMMDTAILPRRRDGQPLVVMVVGVNGVGKTTTVAKLANIWKLQGAKVMMVAADTFRAAAVEQLNEWGRRIDVPVVSGAPDAKPGTVVFDAMLQARQKNIDIVIVDTAGRLHTKTNLMQELEGVRGVIAKQQTGAPHEVILVVDGSTGQNAISQAKEFNDAVALTGLVVTKLDGTPKGGVVVAIKEEIGVPVRYIGVGESPHDLRPFVAREFVEALFDSNDGAVGAASQEQVSAHGETRRRKRRDTQPYI